jgi:hypothetical protein
VTFSQVAAGAAMREMFCCKACGRIICPNIVVACNTRPLAVGARSLPKHQRLLTRKSEKTRNIRSARDGPQLNYMEKTTISFFRTHVGRWLKSIDARSTGKTCPIASTCSLRRLIVIQLAVMLPVCTAIATNANAKAALCHPPQRGAIDSTRSRKPGII